MYRSLGPLRDLCGPGPSSPLSYVSCRFPLLTLFAPPFLGLLAGRSAANPGFAAFGPAPGPKGQLSAYSSRFSLSLPCHFSFLTRTEHTTATLHTQGIGTPFRIPFSIHE